nr:PH domain-containing protein [Actinorugispora endophytica]
MPPRPEADITTGSHRLHGATVALRTAVVTLVFFALPGPILLDFGIGWTLLLTLAVAMGTAAYSLVAWWNTYFGLKGDHLVLHTGLFRQLTREIPLSRLQAVDVVRPLFMQVIGLAELRVELAGGDSGELRLRYLGRGQAERLRASLLAHAAGLSGRTPEAPETPLYKLPFSLLIGALVFRVPVLAAFVLFMLLIVAGLAFGEPGVLGGAVPLLLGLMRGFLGPLLRYIDFYASLSPDGLRLRYGVFQARMQTVPPGRVQAVRIVEPLLWRVFNVVRVEANVAGYVGERQTDSSTLLPVVPKRLAYALVGELFPGTDVSSVTLHPAHLGQAGQEALGVDDSLFVTRRGLFCRVVEIVPHSRMQTLRLTAGPLARMLGAATVEVETPPGPVRARAPHRELGEARRVVDGVAERAERARAASGGPERWATRSDTDTRQ